ncbi:MAG TPA: hypothetical protein VN643_16235 [Pyrinomonadaceae bacterium]|nr:hypothetical protein [Pyrinomonadaceae bacterium]
MSCRHSYAFTILAVITFAITVPAQKSNETSQPKEVRGYKIHRAQVELKKPKESDKKKSGKNAERDEYDEDEPILIRLGEARLVSTSPLGVTLEVPVVLAAVKQQGDVDRLVFEDMRVNDTAVTLDDYVHPFALPNKEPLSLTPPLRIFVSTPQAVLRTIDEIFNSKDVWQVTGRIYVCGQFKKYLFKFKRAVPVDVQTSINNPLR